MSFVIFSHLYPPEASPWRQVGGELGRFGPLTYARGRAACGVAAAGSSARLGVVARWRGSVRTVSVLAAPRGRPPPVGGPSSGALLVVHGEGGLPTGQVHPLLIHVSGGTKHDANSTLFGFFGHAHGALGVFFIIGLDDILFATAGTQDTVANRHGAPGLLPRPSGGRHPPSSHTRNAVLR